MKKEYRVNNLIYAAGNGILNTIRSRIRMTEPVDPVALRKAADLTGTRFPYFSVRMIKRGEEYVLIHNDEPFVITEGGRAIPLGGKESAYHLLALAYDKDTIYVDCTHFITDGNGIFPFIKTLLYCYLHILHPEESFDTDTIALPESDISPEESDDYPFPAEPVEVKPLGLIKRPEKIFMLPDQPEGYSDRQHWTSFSVSVAQKDMMKFASSVDGSPTTFIASMVYRAISDLHPENKLPIVCGIQHQYRKALGKPFSHQCHVNIIPVTYTDMMRGRDLEFLNTMARGVLIICADDTNDMLTVNKHIINEKNISTMTLEQKHEYMRNELLNGIGRNTFEVSYTGRVPFSGIDKYISDFAPILDISLSGGISVEIFAVRDRFFINLMQRSSDEKYYRRFVELFMEYNIKCEVSEPCHFEINDFVLPE